MNYQNRIKDRKIKNTLISLFQLFRFKSLNISFPKKVVIIGNLIGIISLYLPWIVNKDSGDIFNSFHSISGNIGYLLIIVFFISTFTIFSNKYKEKIKLYSDISFKTHFIVITLGIFIFSFSVISLSFITGLQTYFGEIIYGKGVIASMTSSILILVGGYFIRKDFYDKNSEIIFNQINSQDAIATDKNNMKLPF